MAEVSWVPGLIAAGGGLAIGALLAWMQQDQGAAGEERQARLDDLRQRKDLLLEQLRGVEDVDGARGVQAAGGERKTLELEAAAVLKELDELQAGGAAPAKKAATGGGISPQLRGMIQGGVVVGFLAIIAFALSQGTVERVGDMGPTGRAPIVSEMTRTAPIPAAGEPGGAVPGVPEGLQPKESPKLSAARAAVAASPESVEAWANLGYSLIDAEGWIDAFEASRRVLELAPEHPDGLTQQAAVRVAMGQDSLASDLLDRALAQDGKHLAALSYRGMVAWRARDADTAKLHWSKALSIAGPGQGFEGLVAMTEGDLPPPIDSAVAPGSGAPPGHPGGAPSGHPGEFPPAHPGGLPPGHPPAGDAPPAQPAAPTGAVELAGTVTLAPGVSAAPGAVVFITVRPEGQTRGPPSRVKRLPASFPLTFSISDAESMIAGMPFPPSAQLTIRVDADGNAMSKEPTDPQASVVVTAGRTDLAIQLE